MALLSEREKKYAEQTLAIMAIILSVLVILILSRAKTDGPKQPQAPRDWRTEDHRYLAYTVAEQAVTKVLASPGSAQFPGMFEKPDHVRCINGTQRYYVKSWVDSQNTFGALIRTEFEGEVEQVAEDSWQLNSLYINGEKVVER